MDDLQEIKSELSDILSKLDDIERAIKKLKEDNIEINDKLNYEFNEIKEKISNL